MYCWFIANCELNENRKFIDLEWWQFDGLMHPIEILDGSAQITSALIESPTTTALSQNRCILTFAS